MLKLKLSYLQSGSALCIAYETKILLQRLFCLSEIKPTRVKIKLLPAQTRNV